MNAATGNDADARRELQALLEDALARADSLGASLVAAHVSQAIEAVRRR